MSSGPSSSLVPEKRGGWSLASVLAVALIVELIIQLVASRHATSSRPPFLGPTPTTDPRTWSYVPGNLLLGALVYVDEQPSTSLSADQVNVMSRVSEGPSPRSGWEERLRRVYASVLSPEQRADVEAHQDDIVEQELDPRHLLAALNEMGGRATAGPTVSTPRVLQSSVDVTFVVAALQWLVGHSRHPLSPAQARVLALALAPWVEVVEQERDVRARQASVLSPAQMSLMVDLLARARAGGLQIERLQITANEAIDHFRNKGMTRVAPLTR